MTHSLAARPLSMTDHERSHLEKFAKSRDHHEVQAGPSETGFR